MYKFKKNLNLDFRDRRKASEEIGIHFNTLGMILRGDMSTSKKTAYLITKLLNSNAEIDDYFDREYKVTTKEKE